MVCRCPGVRRQHGQVRLDASAILLRIFDRSVVDVPEHPSLVRGVERQLIGGGRSCDLAEHLAGHRVMFSKY
jgi:hypothetical protein